MLAGHTISTTDETGWQDESNGKLLRLAATRFDAFVTVDKNLIKQQNLGELPLPVVVLRCRSNSIRIVARHVPGLLGLFNQSLQHRVYILDEPQEL